MVGKPDRKPSADPIAITRALLEGALHKANDAVLADRMRDWDYAMQSYGDSCALLGRCMERTTQADEEGALHWQIMEGIDTAFAFSLSLPVSDPEVRRQFAKIKHLGEHASEDTQTAANATQNAQVGPSAVAATAAAAATGENYKRLERGLM